MRCCNAQLKNQRKVSSSNYFLLKMIKKFLPLKTRKRFYNYYVKPRFKYCNTILGPWSKSNVYATTKLQKTGRKLTARWKMNKENTTPSLYSPIPKHLTGKPFEENVNYRQALMINKALNNGAPGYMKDMFNTYSANFYSNSKILHWKINFTCRKSTSKA